MEITSLDEICKITKEEDFKAAVAAFDSWVNTTTANLQAKLNQQVQSNEPQKVELHMIEVESWRHRIGRMLMIACAFENHGKSHHFLKTTGTGIEKEAYQKSIIAKPVSLSMYLEGVVRDIDSRVNICKKLVWNETASTVNRRV